MENDVMTQDVQDTIEPEEDVQDTENLDDSLDGEIDDFMGDDDNLDGDDDSDSTEPQ